MSVNFSSISLDLTLFRILDFEVRFLYCALPCSLLQLAPCDAFHQKAARLYIGLWSNTGGSGSEHGRRPLNVKQNDFKKIYWRQDAKGREEKIYFSELGVLCVFARGMSFSSLPSRISWLGLTPAAINFPQSTIPTFH